MFITLLSFQKQHYKPEYPNYVDTQNLSASSSFESNGTLVTGSRKLLRLKLTPENASFPLAVSVYDRTWNESWWKEKTDKNEPLSAEMRNVTISLALTDGNYTTSKTVFWKCDGRYFPQNQRGLGLCKYDTGFASPNFTSAYD